jgi:hypothetical protein
MKQIRLPALTDGQRASWLGLVEVAAIIPNEWSLIGGQLVQLHCWERDINPGRVTNDVDTVLDVKAEPKILINFTAALRSIGFSPDNPTPQGHQHRWTRAEAIIDVLIARGVGERASNRRGISGSTTLGTIGGQGALNHSEKVQIILEETVAVINRPHLMGALIIKSSAFLNPLDIGKDRHLLDLATLASTFSLADAHATVTKKDRSRVITTLVVLRDRKDILSDIDGSLEGIERVMLSLED